MAQAINTRAPRTNSKGWLEDVTFPKLVVCINCLVPAALIAWDGINNRLGANPLDFVTKATGTLALIFLLLSLTVTPLRKLTGWNSLIKHRRTLGLYAFFYLTLHFLAYIWFDKFFRFDEIAVDVYRRPFILVGMASFLLMIPLAVTSTNKMIKRLGGKRWSRLHKLVYVCAAGGVLHYYLLVKSDTTKPLIFALILAVLLGYRYVVARMKSTTVPAPSITPQRK
jgi:sulfoxide reductase heme-binding subunit YedZ